MGSDWAAGPRPRMGQSGAGQRQARGPGLSVCGDSRSALPGAAGVGDDPAGIGPRLVVSVPRPLACRAGAPGG